MILNGYSISAKTINKYNKIIDRIKELGINYYKYREYYPVYIIHKDIDYIYFETKKDIEYFTYLLGYGFEGLVEDEEKIDMIEQFGKYNCIIERINEEYDGNIDYLFGENQN